MNLLLGLLLFYLGMGAGLALFHFRTGGKWDEALYLIVAWPSVMFWMWRN